MKTVRFILMLVIAGMLGIAGGQRAWAQSPTTAAVGLPQLNTYVAQSLALARANDLGAAATTFEQFRAGWPAIEDGIRVQSRTAYSDIETFMGDARYALEHKDQAQSIIALEKLLAVNNAFIGGAAPAAAPAPGDATLVELDAHLQAARAAAGRGDTQGSLAAMQAFQTMWPDVEGLVKVRSEDTYSQIEAHMPEAMAALRQNDLASTTVALDGLSAELQPMLVASQYGVFDALSILLREGLEALLVITALLAFLTRSGNADKRRWIWVGGLLGILASIITALILNLVFKGIATGTNREILEGITGLIAAVMLFSVSYWLHSKSQMGVWQRYIRTKTTAALATGSLFSLALLAFLAVYREGAETTLFYIGMAPSIATGDLLMGMSLATAILVVCGVLVLWMGVKIPLRPFFQITSLLIFYLGFKFIGTGVHGLQIGQIVPTTTSAMLPSSGFFGLFPTWESTIPQAVLLITAGLVILFNQRKHRLAGLVAVTEG